MACSGKKGLKKDKIFPDNFKSFYVRIDSLMEIDDTKQSVHLPNSGPAVLKYVEIEEGAKYYIGYAGSLGEREIQYFKSANNTYIEDIDIGYNKMFGYDLDTVKFRIIRRDTTKYFITDDVLVRYSSRSDSILVENQISQELRNKSTDLLKQLEEIKQASNSW